MAIETILIIVWMHFFADFILQTRWMGRNKSKGVAPLVAHVVVYSIPFMLFGWKYAIANGTAHFVTDFASSRISGKLWANKKEFLFWAVIGADQAIHITTLVVTYGYFVT